MAHFLLVHGSNHGAWCWRDVIGALEALGHSAEAIDLPGAGADDTPLDAVTLEGYGDAVLSRLDRPTVLVAHSAGGFAITQAAERDPTHVAGLVYVTAYVPVEGKSLVDMLKDAPSQPLKDALEVAPDRKSIRFKPVAVRDALYQDCPEGAVDFAMAHLGWQPLKPQLTPVTMTGASASIPRRYVLCTEDRAVPPEHQLQMAAEFAEADIDRLDCGHSPFFALPEVLAERLAAFCDAT